MKELAILSCERKNEIKMGKDRFFEVDKKELKVLMFDKLNEVEEEITWEEVERWEWWGW